MKRRDEINKKKKKKARKGERKRRQSLANLRFSRVVYRIFIVTVNGEDYIRINLEEEKLIEALTLNKKGKIKNKHET